ncbi:olfactory receptor-like protein OLF3 [Rana temporaria]|uniref:olfactory receptor-like protein OLF3 n=1 Tax=Rana temporaria TaxID=8407 RepID=UPI001AAC6FB4|nr:olfactory receptor-like protein OLF3 [Rana temporaria]
MKECFNNTSNTFYILAFSTSNAGGLVLFTGVLLMYLMTVTGNLLITTLICLVPRLHTPMYFFLCNLSIVDVIYVSSILPKLLSVTLTKAKAMSFSGCIAQTSFLVLSVVCDMLVLTAMSYDRYVAVCKPLQYHLIMNTRVCTIVAISIWLIAIINSVKYGIITSVLSFCSPQNLDHFYCDLKTLYTVTTSDTSSREILIIVDDIFLAFIPFSLVLISYVYIISSIMKISSSAGRVKAFSSCTSHITTVILFYGPAIIHYADSEAGLSKEGDKVMSLIYMALVPMLNPVVYTLRNKEVLGAIKKLQPATNKLMYNIFV